MTGMHFSNADYRRCRRLNTRGIGRNGRGYSSVCSALLIFMPRGQRMLMDDWRMSDPTVPSS